ncbi:MerR family transcriptional regulator [Amycolatopsis sp. CA-230715]|uniref:MerR family transcriptional regulator n=1 Tax=Amycolatopsis sp. CA-230715 TaxID=2745196 RepID=UPI001C0311F8|nr:MerR family transcriptional regulator [Amycolatopsis sp. CA-230715]QWF80895.1 Mercuric resistance operon regulatory protein [Amycolatopsis sp. CA-230715]
MWQIGEAAAKVGVAVSALRYWDERGLVPPAERKAGVRWYGDEEMHRLAAVKLLQDTGMMSLDEIAVIVDGRSRGDWRAAMKSRLEEVRAQQERLAAAQGFLEHFLRCPSDEPIVQCPRMRDYTDRALRGGAEADLAG